MAIHHSQLSIVVVMVGETDYWKISRAFIEQYCNRCGYDLIIHSRRQTPEPWHPSWDKLVAPASSPRPHVLLWDADLLPMPLCPPVHFFLDPARLGMVRIEPSPGGRRKLRRRYGLRAERHMHYNCGLVSVPEQWRKFLSDLHKPENFRTSIFWEQGAVNEAIRRQQVDVDSMDPRWNVWVSGKIDESLIDSAFCLHFAKGSARRLRNIWRLCRILRRRKQLPRIS